MADTLNSRNRRPKTRNVFLSFIVTLIFITALFISAGSLAWIWGWMFVGIMVANKVVSIWLLDPGLLEERTSVKRDYKRGDILLSTIMGRLGPLAIIIICGLDFRFGWSGQLPLALTVLGFISLILAYILILWAMKENRFFSAIVRIQSERGHQVITTGPYRLVRHPGYLGTLVHTLALPFALASYWALIPAVVTSIFSLVRTYLEDNTLKRELAGYSQYAEKVRYRLLPGIW